MSNKIRNKYDIENNEDTNAIALLGRALSSPIRIEMLRLLNGKARHLSEISEIMGLQISSTAFHLKVLEDAGIITVENSTKRKGSIKFFSYGIHKKISVFFRKETINLKKLPVTLHLKIGDFIDASLDESCGIASETKALMENSPKKIFSPERTNAQLIWCKNSGYLTYAIPNDFSMEDLNSVSFSMELCSETNGYNSDFPSDITFWINGVEICTWISPGDFGDHYGKFTPPWWFPESTKYGILTTVSVKQDGVYLNEQLINKKIDIDSLSLSKGNRITFTVGVKPNAKHKGGFNIFGENFGEYNQGIIFSATYNQK